MAIGSIKPGPWRSKLHPLSIPFSMLPRPMGVTCWCYVAFEEPRLSACLFDTVK